ncbi:MAG: hypothetical protein MZU91_02640 [Desulfosudis oleivorans]|nr:hypothetical protein [Desulfosudis oleivorans]
MNDAGAEPCPGPEGVIAYGAGYDHIDVEAYEAQAAFWPATVGGRMPRPLPSWPLACCSAC